MNCTALPSGMNWKTSSNKTSSPLAPSSTGNTVTIAQLHCSSAPRAEGKENADMENKGWLSKVCNKLRSKHRRPEKCEKCGQRSETCRPNPSFISGRKHFLCEDCRVSSHNMKTMYHQLCRNLSLREHSRTTTCTSGDGDLSSPGSSRGGLSRSKSLKVRPTSPESGYDTATSLDSSSSERLSADPASTSSRECGASCSPHLDTGVPTCLPVHHHGDCGEKNAATDHHVCSKDDRDDHVCSKDRAEVFGGAFKVQKVHLHHLQQVKPQPRIYTRQPPAQPSKTTQDSHAKNTAATKHYDGYLEIRTPNSRSVKYVFKKPEGGVEEAGQTPEKQAGERRKDCEDLKQCYRCHKRRTVAFRAPFGHGWLCENCMDDLM